MPGRCGGDVVDPAVSTSTIRLSWNGRHRTGVGAIRSCANLARSVRKFPAVFNKDWRRRDQVRAGSGHGFTCPPDSSSARRMASSSRPVSWRNMRTARWRSRAGLHVDYQPVMHAPRSHHDQWKTGSAPLCAVPAFNLVEPAMAPHPSRPGWDARRPAARHHQGCWQFQWSTRPPAAPA